MLITVLAMMDFLYFPEDKSEYIPAFIVLVIFMFGAVIAMQMFYKKSRKDEKKFNEQYKEYLQEERDHQEDRRSTKN